MAARGGNLKREMGEGDFLPRCVPAHKIEEGLSMHIVSRANIRGGAMFLEADGGQLHRAFSGLAGDGEFQVRCRNGQDLWCGKGWQGGYGRGQRSRNKEGGLMFLVQGRHVKTSARNETGIYIRINLYS
jgi:hypothetical protein